MDARTPFRCAVFVLASTIFTLPLFAQYVCSFATREAALKAARDRYAYTLDVTVETLNGNAVNGSYHQLSEVSSDNQGQRVERATFAPQSTLSGLGVTKDDLDDIRDRLPLVLRAQELSLYSITYVGWQRVDQLDSYVFDVAPKDPKKEPRRFHGRVWVEARDLVVVKTCGKTRSDEIGGSLGKNSANLTPTFVTYREQIDGKYWFTTYARADEYLHFPRGGAHIREVVKYSNYKSTASK